METKKTMSLLLAVLLFSVSVYSLVWAADYQPPADKGKNSSASSERVISDPRTIGAVSETDDFSPRLFGIWNGKAAVFRPGASEPEAVLSADCGSLPEEVAERLKEGIIVYTREQYYSYLEDFS